jgi:hypothetical protein
MEKELAIYVSAAPEMDAECELLGQLLATLPKSVRWTIKRTPGPHELGIPDLEALSGSQFYVILLGMDIMAPIGVELQAALEERVLTMAYRSRRVAPSPAAAYFAQNAPVEWHWYDTPQEFVQQLEKRLITELISGTPGYGLGLSDLEELSARLRALEKEADSAEDDERRGAGRGGVILPAGR